MWVSPSALPLESAPNCVSAALLVVSRVPCPALKLSLLFADFAEAERFLSRVCYAEGSWRRSPDTVSWRLMMTDADEGFNDRRHSGVRSGEHGAVTDGVSALARGVIQGEEACLPRGFP
ncbi:MULTISPECIES: hypothetical protein [Lonsdalea]|uniref:hypothetical protein n=1 Tax=Lonsdalea TaxID=1082702 RepID=UPI00111BF7C8|nr:MULTISPECIES: hypothetical protein [Lonsdalea]QPQ23064.1 hypothetical protein I6N93_10260 [Lonsdalea populi]